MKRMCSVYGDRAAQVVFHPALTPLEAAMVPAKPAAARGALALVCASFAPGRGMRISARRSASGRCSPAR